MAHDQAQIDQRNAEFWDELCGTTLAQQLGINEPSPENLKRFDRAYLDAHPYLEGYLPKDTGGAPLLEIGLGYGTVSQILAANGADYHGLDIAEGPVKMVRHRLAVLGVDRPDDRVMTGSALDIPHSDGSFEHVITIGCLHHTGDIPRGVAEVERVLRPGGRAVVMLYNRRSYRRMKQHLASFRGRLRGANTDEEELRASYDHNTEGQAAPVIDYTTIREAKRLFSGFSKVRVRRENFDYMMFRRRPVDRGKLLGWPARIAGLDLYIRAVK